MSKSIEFIFNLLQCWTHMFQLVSFLTQGSVASFLVCSMSVTGRCRLWFGTYVDKEYSREKYQYFREAAQLSVNDLVIT